MDKFWINFLHIYQPSYQDKETLKRVINESYNKIIALAEKYPKAIFTINITGSLLEILEEQGFSDVIEKFKLLLENNNIELTGSAMYHPILPLIPEWEMKRQIELNEDILIKYFGKLYKRNGFYFPEMAYSKKAGDVIVKFGFKWIILDEIHLAKPVSYDTNYKLKNGLSVIFRNRKLSSTFPPESLSKKLEKNEIIDDYIVTAHDGELYGHRHKDKNADLYYDKIFTQPELKSVTVSNYLARLKKIQKVSLREASWETTEKELKSGVPYFLWQNPKNKVHKNYWLLTDFVLKLINSHKKDKNIYYAQRHLDRGLASCGTWWASNAKPQPSSVISWNPDEIEKSALELIKSVRSLTSAEKSEKIKAEKYYSQLLKEIWIKHHKK